MPSLLCAHIPLPRLSEYRSYLLDSRINPEIYIPSESLDSLDIGQLKLFASDLKSAGLSCTIHATFMDLNPGSVDCTVRECTRRRVQQTFEAGSILKPRVIVFHPGYSRLSYGSAVDIWVDNSISFWRDFTDSAHDIGTNIAIENIFEEEPSTIRRVLEGIDDPAAGHCFDTGHFNMFSTVSMEQWFEELGRFIFEAHLHDNHGKADEHLPVGEGEIDFELVTSLLNQLSPDAVWTLEAHSRERLERSMRNIKKYL